MIDRSPEVVRKLYYRLEEFPWVDVKPLRPNAYTLAGKSMVSMVRTDDREQGIKEAVKLLGGLGPLLKGRDGDILIKPNCNNPDPFPASAHYDTIRVMLQMILESGVPSSEIALGDTSMNTACPTRETMKKMGVEDVATKLGVSLIGFEEGEWVRVRPEKATTWPNGFWIPRPVYEASRIIALPCLKTHRFGGVFTMAMKGVVGTISPADRIQLHASTSTIMRDMIADANLAYSVDFIVTDGMKCLVTGGPMKGEEASPGVILASGDRVAVDAVGAALLKSLRAGGLMEKPIREQGQIKRARSTGLGHCDLYGIELKTSDLVGDEAFKETVDFVRKELS